jgi:predicted MFS family arabinose efflux permease
MSAVVLGLVEAGGPGWGNPITVASFAAGAVLLAAFVWDERRAQEPILPLRLLANPTRSGANLARGLVYAGMYGSFFFLSQFLQDVQGYSPLAVGVGFLPIPASVFLASQLASKVLVRRVPPRALMLSGAGLATASLVLSSQLHAGASYLQVLLNLVLLGVGIGVSLVSLTSASLTGVDPKDAGAASGLVNVVQQLGAALGLAVLVTVFGEVTGHGQLASAIGSAASSHADAVLVHGLDVAFAVGAGFALLAMAIVALFIKPAPQLAAGLRPTPQARLEEEEPELDLSELEEALGMEEAAEPAIVGQVAEAFAGSASQANA